MEGIVILLFLLALGPLAMLFGVDSRTWDERGWWPGSPRRDGRVPDAGQLQPARRAGVSAPRLSPTHSAEARAVAAAHLPR